MRVKVPIIILVLFLGSVGGGLLAAHLSFASRNGSGTYTLPAGNPVVTGTTISSTWANNTMSDLGTETTNSLDRNGRGGMLAQLNLINGSASAPSLAFTSQTNTGLYRAAASDMRCTVNGADAFRFTTTANFAYGPGSAPSLTGTYAGVGLIGAGAGASSSTNVTNAGLVGVGGTLGGTGVVGIGNSANGNGVQGTGAGSGNGVSGTGGTTSSAGLFGTGGTPNGNGATAQGTGTGPGISATGGATNGIGGSFANGVAATASTRQDAVTLTNGDLNLSGVVNANSTVGFTNRLTTMNLTKAWGRLTTDGAGNVSVTKGFNIASVAISGSNARVNFASAMADTNYGLVITSTQGNGPAWGTCTINSTSQVDISLWTATASQVNLSNTIYTFTFAVLGAQ